MLDPFEPFWAYELALAIHLDPPSVRYNMYKYILTSLLFMYLQTLLNNEETLKLQQGHSLTLWNEA